VAAGCDPPPFACCATVVVGLAAVVVGGAGGPLVLVLVVVVVAALWRPGWPEAPLTGMRRRPPPEAATAMLMGSAGEMALGPLLGAKGDELAALGPAAALGPNVKKLALDLRGGTARLSCSPGGGGAAVVVVIWPKAELEPEPEAGVLVVTLVKIPPLFESSGGEKGAPETVCLAGACPAGCCPSGGAVLSWPLAPKVVLLGAVLVAPAELAVCAPLAELCVVASAAAAARPSLAVWTAFAAKRITSVASWGARCACCCTTATLWGTWGR